MPEKKDIVFNNLKIEVNTMEGGHLLSSTLSLDGEVVGQSQRIVTGKEGSPIIGSRIRKAVKVLLEDAFPKAAKVLASADLPGQTVIPGTR